MNDSTHYFNQTFLKITPFEHLLKNEIELLEGDGDGDKGTETWGVRLDAKNITSTGLTLRCSQFDGEPRGELQTGSYYFLEKQVDSQWVSLEMLPSKSEIAWTDEAWIIPMADTIEWEVNWEELYEELAPGYYRIGKNIMDFRDTGDYDEKTYYANFEVLN